MGRSLDATLPSVVYAAQCLRRLIGWVPQTGPDDVVGPSAATLVRAWLAFRGVQVAFGPAVDHGVLDPQPLGQHVLVVAVAIDPLEGLAVQHRRWRAR